MDRKSWSSLWNDAMSINFPPELLASITAAAERAGITVEEFVVQTLKANIPVVAENGGKPLPAVPGQPTMYDKLAKYIGSIDGPSEPWSENTGERFANIVAENLQRERK